MNEVIDVDYIETKNSKMISISSSIKYLAKTFIDNPIKLIKSYINNYFSIIDIYRTTTKDGVGYVSEKKLDINFSNELTVIGNKPYSNVDSNFFPLSDELYQNAINYYSPNHANLVLNKITQKKLGEEDRIFKEEFKDFYKEFLDKRDEIFN